MKKITLLFTLCAVALISFAQLSIKGTPKSFSYRTKNHVPVVELQKPDMDKIKNQDADAANKSRAYRNGVLLDTDINPNNSGVWDFLPDGSAIWRIAVKSEEATALGLYFSDWKLTPGAEVYVYTPDKYFVIGAFTELNNIDLRTMATQEIPGDEAIIEMFVPDRNQDFALELNQVAYFYRGISIVRDERVGTCHVNVVCSEADNYRDQIRSVAKIEMLIGNYVYMCTGSLVNNIKQDCKPYFLTADHCSVGESNVIVTAAELSKWTFKFNYQSSKCTTNVAGTSKVYTGATYIASDNFGVDETGSDFFLCLLNNTPEKEANAYYNGWTYLGGSPGKCVGIHHPDGSIKKISTASYGAINLYSTHWGIVWTATDNGRGVTEGGSSGSPLFDENRRLVGTLTGGTSACTVNGAGAGTGPDKTDIYGKFSKHWNSNGNTNDKQLKPWLDPSLVSGGSLNGRDNCFVGLDDVEYVRANIKVYPNPVSDVLKIDFSNYNVENATITITDILGKTVIEPIYGDFMSKTDIKVSELEKGMYFIKVQTKQNIISLPFVVD